jgi:hypothetical protein
VQVGGRRGNGATSRTLEHVRDVENFQQTYATIGMRARQYGVAIVCPTHCALVWVRVHSKWHRLSGIYAPLQVGAKRQCATRGIGGIGGRVVATTAVAVAVTVTVTVTVVVGIGSASSATPNASLNMHWSCGIGRLRVCELVTVTPVRSITRYAIATWRRLSGTVWW